MTNSPTKISNAKSRRAAQHTEQTSPIEKTEPVECRLLKIDEVLALTCMSRSRLYSEICKGKFPAQIKIGPRASAWLMSEVVDWIQARVDARNTKFSEAVK